MRFAWIALIALAFNAAGNNQGMPTVEADRFAQLEQRLQAAEQKRDRTALAALLAEDFELREARNSSELVLREEWLESIARRPAQPACAMGELMPRIFERTAVISFICAAGGRDYFVVDVWRQTGSGWRLAARYLSTTPEQPASDVKTKH